LKTIGHSLKNLGPSQKTLRPTWLRAWAKPSDGLAFFTNYRDMTLILRWLSTSCSRRNAGWILYFDCARNRMYFAKSNCGYGIRWFAPMHTLIYF